RPAAATDAWKRLAGGDVPWIEGALQGLTVIEAANAEEEALAIAISLREAIETPAKTAALVTPDRALARRVLAALERWNVAVEDSAGEELADPPAGPLARPAAEARLGGRAPVALLDAAAALLARLAPALAPLEGQARAPFAKIAALHRSVVAALSADATGVPAAFQGRDGVALESAFDEIAANASHADFAVEA